MTDTMPPVSDRNRQARPPHSCSGCDSRWSGARIAHCACCHETFTTPANFDRHRARQYREVAGRKIIVRDYGECHDPGGSGLVLNERGQWAEPGRDEVDD